MTSKCKSLGLIRFWTFGSLNACSVDSSPARKNNKMLSRSLLYFKLNMSGIGTVKIKFYFQLCAAIMNVISDDG